MQNKAQAQDNTKNNQDTKLNSNMKKALRILKIVKNVVLSIIFAALVCLVMVVLIARTNGETPTVFGHTVYRVISPSMTPILQVGDIILCRECDPMELKVDDIITYNGTDGQLAGKRVTHRVAQEPYLNSDDGKYYLVTKGDNNPVEDSPIEISQVTGKFVSKMGLLKTVYDFFLTPWGLLTIIFLILLAFSNEIVNVIRAVAGKDEPQEDIQEVIERVQREAAEEKKKEAEQEALEQTSDSTDKN